MKPQTKSSVNNCYYWLLCILIIFPFKALISQSIDYDRVIQPIFNTYCVACHGGTSGINMNTYEAVMNSVGLQYRTNIVIPGSPSTSPLVDKVANSNPTYGARMPQGGPFLSQQQINDIIAWISAGATSITRVDGEIPVSFELLGNYPNPFNPSTNIHFKSPQSSSLLIQVYSTLGQNVLNETVNILAGAHYYTVDLRGFPSGVYLYTLTFSDNGFITKQLTGKMLLLN